MALKYKLGSAATHALQSGSPDAAELAAITDVLENYEIKRWPLGKIPGGKG